MSRSHLFIDTAYVYALFNTRDQWHAKATELQHKVVSENSAFITTQSVLAEIADGFSSLRFRRSAVEIVRGFLEDPLVEVVSASDDLFYRGLDLYESRPDKAWGLTDCFSFIVMQDRGLTDALTADDHFRQAGFNALLLD